MMYGEIKEEELIKLTREEGLSIINFLIGYFEITSDELDFEAN